MKKGDSKISSLKYVLLFSLLAFGFVLFSNQVSAASVSLVTLHYNENITNHFNFTVSAGSDINITNVNITLPADVVFNLGSNNTGIQVKHLFSNTSTILSWTNSSVGSAGAPFFLLNATETINFNFTANTSIPGNYSITVILLRAAGTYLANFTINVNDTTAPHNVSFDGSTPTTNLSSQNWIEVNITVNDSEGAYGGQKLMEELLGLDIYLQKLKIFRLKGFMI